MRGEKKGQKPNMKGRNEIRGGEQTAVTNWFHCSANESNNSRDEPYRVRRGIARAEGVACVASHPCARG